jgi:TolA-binding protein
MTADNAKSDLRRNPLAVWVDWSFWAARQYRTALLIALAAATVAGLALAGYSWFQERREGEARASLVLAYAKLRGEKTGETGNPDEAMQIFDSLAGRFAGTVSAEEALIRLGNLQDEKQKFEAAFATFSRYLQEYPRGRYRVLASIGKAYVAETLGRLDDAVKTLTDILITAKDDPIIGEAYASLARMYEIQKKPDEAMKIYGQISEKFPQSQWAQQALQQMSRLRTK